MGELHHRDCYECLLTLQNAWPAHHRSHGCIHTLTVLPTLYIMLRHLVASGRRAAVLRHLSHISQVCMLVQMSSSLRIPRWLLQTPLAPCYEVVSGVCTLLEVDGRPSTCY